MTRLEYRALRERAYRDASDFAALGLVLTLFALMWPLLGGATVTVLVLAVVNLLRFMHYDKLMRRTK